MKKPETKLINIYDDDIGKYYGLFYEINETDTYINALQTDLESRESELRILKEASNKIIAEMEAYVENSERKLEIFAKALEHYAHPEIKSDYLYASPARFALQEINKGE